MTSAFESVFSEVMADLDKQRQNMVRFHQSLDEITATVRSKRRQVSATVDARGDLVDLKFHGDSYRTMPATELARLVLDTIRQAKQDARAQMWDSMADVLPRGADIAEVVSGDYDWSTALGESLTLPEPLMDFINESRERVFGGSGLDALRVLPGMGQTAGNGNDPRSGEASSNGEARSNGHGRTANSNGNSDSNGNGTSNGNAGQRPDSRRD